MRQHKLPPTTGIRKLVHKLRTKSSVPMPKLPAPYQRLIHHIHDLKRNRVCACACAHVLFLVLMLMRRTCEPDLIVHCRQYSPSSRVQSL